MHLYMLSLFAEKQQTKAFTLVFTYDLTCTVANLSRGICFIIDTFDNIFK